MLRIDLLIFLPSIAAKRSADGAARKGELPGLPPRRRVAEELEEAHRRVALAAAAERHLAARGGQRQSNFKR